jgi:putative FmdB family regulatory protein
MPTYVYGCDTCSHRFEIFQKFSDAPLTDCPACGARVRKIFQPAGIVFKGSGWYYTDSRAGKSSNGSSADGDKGAGTTPPKGGDTQAAGTTKSETTASA